MPKIVMVEKVMQQPPRIELSTKPSSCINIHADRQERA
jgi:hypothetical protein